MREYAVGYLRSSTRLTVAVGGRQDVEGSIAERGRRNEIRCDHFEFEERQLARERVWEEVVKLGTCSTGISMSSKR